MTSASRPADDGFGRVLEYLDRQLEFDSGTYNDSYLDRRITARMRRVDADDYGTYLDVLREDDDEQSALLESLSINVTSFFRNPEMWEALRSVLRDLTADGPTSVWSVPCSDGREPYSLVMLALADPQIDADRLEVVGSDIDPDAIARAREGVYHDTRTGDIPEELSLLEDPERYVERDGDRFAVRDVVRDHVRFERHDLIRDGSRSGFDLVLCRNLLIYVDQQYDATIVGTALDSLGDDGYLVIGMSETLPRTHRDALEPVDRRRRIYRTR